MMQQREDDGERRSRSPARRRARAPARRARRSPSEVIVTPSCIAAMKRGGSAVIRSTARARRFPSRSSSRIRVRREVTSPYSAATKDALSRISPRGRAAREELHRACAAEALVRSRRARRPSSHRSLAEPAGARPADTNICSILGRCAPTYREEPCRTRAQPRLGACRSPGRSTPTWAASTAARFCYVRAFELRADRPAGDALRQLDPRQGQRRRGARARARAPLVARRERSRSAPRPIPTSRPRAASG